jgi:malate synthase
VREDKEREAAAGFDGTWIAHPDLVATALQAFDDVLGERANQIARQRDDVDVTAADLLSLPDTPGEVTEQGIRTNVSVGIRNLASRLNGNGAAAIDNLMEDAATAEISRGQLWQWVHHGRTTAEEVWRIRDEELARIGGDWPRIDEAARLFEQVALADEFPDFLTLPAYELLG